jgi:hypothetical protein
MDIMAALGFSEFNGPFPGIAMFVECEVTIKELF